MPNDEFVGTILRMGARDQYALVEACDWEMDHGHRRQGKARGKPETERQRSVAAVKGGGNWEKRGVENGQAKDLGSRDAGHKETELSSTRTMACSGFTHLYFSKLGRRIELVYSVSERLWGISGISVPQKPGVAVCVCVATKGTGDSKIAESNLTRLGVHPLQSCFKLFTR